MGIRQRRFAASSRALDQCLHSAQQQFQKKSGRVHLFPDVGSDLLNHRLVWYTHTNDVWPVINLNKTCGGRT